MTDMRHIAKLSTGGEVEIVLPLHSTKSMGYPESWRMDSVGVLINLAQVVSISGAPTEGSRAGKKLVALIDVEGDRWITQPGERWSVDGQPALPWRTRAGVERGYGPVREVWE